MFYNATERQQMNANNNITQRQKLQLYKDATNKSIFTIDTKDLPNSNSPQQAQQIAEEVSRIIGPGHIMDLCFNNQGRWIIRLDDPTFITTLTNTTLHIQNTSLTITPRSKHSILITTFADPSVTNSELREKLKPFGKVIHVAYGYHEFDKKIRDGRRFINFIPEVEVTAIPHSINVEGMVFPLHFKGKRVHCKKCNTRHTFEEPCTETPSTPTDTPQTPTSNTPYTTDDTPQTSAETPPTADADTPTPTTNTPPTAVWIDNIDEHTQLEVEANPAAKPKSKHPKLTETQIETILNTVHPNKAERRRKHEEEQEKINEKGKKNDQNRKQLQIDICIPESIGAETKKEEKARKKTEAKKRPTETFPNLQRMPNEQFLNLHRLPRQTRQKTGN